MPNDPLTCSIKASSIRISSSVKHWVIIPAAGVGKRMQASQPKQYLPLSGAPVLERTLYCFLNDADFSGVLVGISEGDGYWSALSSSSHDKISTFPGGKERVDTVRRGLGALEDLAADDDWIWVHDAARPCLTSEDILLLKEALNEECDGALLAVKVNDTVKQANAAGQAEKTVDRELLWRAMTPQVFRYRDLKKALDTCQNDGVFVTDDASAMEYIGMYPSLIAGSEQNIKITRPEDLAIAEQFFNRQRAEKQDDTMIPRIGSGYDVHAFEEGEFVTIGGVKIPHTHGLKAHSDGDVLLHALCDALLGALALGDIGRHFPDTDEKWKGADSRMLLRGVYDLVKERGYRVGNVDLTVIAQAPKMAPHISAIQENIAADLDVQIDAVGVKATTTEKLGFTGRKEGIAAQASALLVPES